MWRSPASSASSSPAPRRRVLLAPARCGSSLSRGPSQPTISWRTPAWASGDTQGEQRHSLHEVVRIAARSSSGGISLSSQPAGSRARASDASSSRSRLVGIGTRTDSPTAKLVILRGLPIILHHRHADIHEHEASQGVAATTSAASWPLAASPRTRSSSTELTSTRNPPARRGPRRRSPPRRWSLDTSERVGQPRTWKAPSGGRVTLRMPPKAAGTFAHASDPVPAPGLGFQFPLAVLTRLPVPNADTS